MWKATLSFHHTTYSIPNTSYDFRRQLNNLLISHFAKLARNWPENAASYRFVLHLIHDNDGIFIETNIRTVSPTKWFLLTHDHRVCYFLFLQSLSRFRLLY